MAKIQIVGNDWQTQLKKHVYANPTEVHQILLDRFRAEFPRWTRGYERTDASKGFMTSFIERKAIASGNPIAYISNML